MRERTADASTSDLRLMDVGALRRAFNPDNALRRLADVARSGRSDSGDGSARRGVPIPSPADPQRQVQLVTEVLNALDDLLDAPIEERLAVAAARAAECVGAAAWRVSHVDGEIVRLQQLEVIRTPHVGAGSAPENVGDRRLASRPAVVAAVEGSAFGVSLGTGDAVERRLLDEQGRVSAVVAGGYDPDARQWLVELRGDESTHEMTSFAATLLALVQAALGFPREISPPRATH